MLRLTERHWETLSVSFLARKMLHHGNLTQYVYLTCSGSSLKRLLYSLSLGVCVVSGSGGNCTES